jgi:hypothetical protein
MNSAPKNIAIEKNRMALLRLVRWWLLIATMFHAERVLPRRIGLWVSDTIFKLERATYYLQIASGFVQPAMPVQQHDPITINAAVTRLKAVKKALIRLKPSAEGQPQHDQCLARPLLNNHSRGCAFYIRSSAARLVLAVFNCRAPPCLYMARLNSKFALYKLHHLSAIMRSHAFTQPERLKPTIPFDSLRHLR